MKGEAVFRALSAAEPQQIEDAAPQSGGQMPDISGVLSAIRQDAREEAGVIVPQAHPKSKEGKIASILRISCAVAACAVLVTGGILFAHRGGSEIMEQSSHAGAEVTEIPETKPVSTEIADETVHLKGTPEEAAQEILERYRDKT